MNKEKIKCWPEVVVPMDDNLDIDFGQYKKLIEFYIETGADALHLNGFFGEADYLSAEEQLRLIAEAKRICSDKMFVAATGNTIGEKLTDNVDFTRETVKAGADAVFLTPPKFCGEDAGQEDLEKYFLMMAEMTDAPLGVYEYPYVDMMYPDFSVIRVLSESGSYIYYKEYGSGAGRLKKILESAGKNMLVVATGTGLGSEEGEFALSDFYCAVFPDKIVGNILTNSNDNAGAAFESADFLTVTLQEDSPVLRKAALKELGVLSGPLFGRNKNYDIGKAENLATEILKHFY